MVFKKSLLANRSLLSEFFCAVFLPYCHTSWFPRCVWTTTGVTRCSTNHCRMNRKWLSAASIVDSEHWVISSLKLWGSLHHTVTVGVFRLLWWRCPMHPFRHSFEREWILTQPCWNVGKVVVTKRFSFIYHLLQVWLREGLSDMCKCDANDCNVIYFLLGPSVKFSSNHSWKST